MRAIVLAAGMGARMRTLNEHTHKSLLPIGNTTILGRIVDALLDINVRDILVVTGYCSRQIRSFLAERYPGSAFTFVHNQRWGETNNVVSLAMALEHSPLDCDNILIECDVLFDPALLQRLTGRKRGNVALLDRYRPGMHGTVVSVERGVITQVFPPHLQTEDFDYRDKFKTVNIYRFDKDFCRTKLKPLLSCYANVIDSGSYYEAVLGMLINMQREIVHAELVNGAQWAEVDDPNDLAAARFAFEPEQRAKILSHACGGHWNFDLLDFTFMRNMYFPADAMLAAIGRRLPALARSYGSSQEILNEKLAFTLGCRADRLQCLSGASQLFPLLPDLIPARRVLLPQPTFAEFPRWFPAHAAYQDSVGIDPDEIDARAEINDLVVIVNPNNPTGSKLATAGIHALIARHPHTTFLVDESFIAFSGDQPLLERLEREPLKNVVVVVSLSKSLGVPGLRLGYAYSCDPQLIQRLRARIPIWNLGSLAEFFLELLLKFQPEYALSIRRTVSDRCEFGTQLAGLAGVETVYPSSANFFLIRLASRGPEHAQQLVDALLTRHSIYVKDVSRKFAAPAPYLRVAVRRPAENVRLLEALAEELPSLEL